MQGPGQSKPGKLVEEVEYLFALSFPFSRSKVKPQYIATVAAEVASKKRTEAAQTNAFPAHRRAT